MKSHLKNLLATITLCLFMAGCAQLGPPLPPSLELPKPPSDLRASRKGNHVTLTWSEPTLTTDRQSVRYIGPTLICRSPKSEIGDCQNPAGTLPAPPAAARTQISKQPSKKTTGQKPGPAPPTPQAYVDTLPASLQPQNPAAEVTYAVEVLNRDSRGAGLSNRVQVPAFPTLPPPTDLSATLNGDGVALAWTSAGEPQASPGIQHHYRIYRRDEGSGKDAVAGEVPLQGTEPGPVHYADSGFEWEKTYLYRVTVVSIVEKPGGEAQIEVEGDDTPPVRVVAHDVFPPTIPTGLQAGYSGAGQEPFIDLIWAPVTNADLAGYNVYRSEYPPEMNTQAIKLNSELVKSPSYRDRAVASGKTYTYSVSSVDVRGNESQRSEQTSEPVP